MDGTSTAFAEMTSPPDDRAAAESDDAGPSSDPMDRPGVSADGFATNRAEESAADREAARPDTPSAAEISPRQVVEAILLSADSPLPAAKIAQVLGVGDARDVRKHIQALNDFYGLHGCSFRIEEIAGGYQILTLPQYNTWLVKLLRARQETKLSPAAMETLAVIAYKQPCTRADIESVRGVAAGEMLNRLRELNLVKVVGRAEDLGRPLLYGTTRRFLEVFGLASLEDLPQVEVLRGGAASAGSAAGGTSAEVFDYEGPSAVEVRNPVGGVEDSQPHSQEETRGTRSAAHDAESSSLRLHVDAQGDDAADDADSPERAE